MPLGGKFTTGRCDSVEIVDRVFAALGKLNVESTTHERTLPGAPINEFTGWQAEATSALLERGVDPESAEHLTERYGTRLPRLFELFGENPAWCERLHPSAPFLKAEAILAVRDEMAGTLIDVVRRRMPLILVVRREPEWLKQVAKLIAPELGWDATEIARQVSAAMT
jgi:glycerol-3-phosphate dehydrogenase